MTSQGKLVASAENVELMLVWKSYTASSSDELSLRQGDIVEVLDTSDPTSPKRRRLDPELDQVPARELLDNSAAKHKLAVKPKRTHIHPKQGRISATATTGRWLVRVCSGDQKEGWVPSSILQPLEEPEELISVTEAAARREAVVRELVETEHEFVRDLQHVVQHYLKAAESGKIPRSLRDNYSVIFGNIRQISDFHSTVLMEGVKYYASEPHMLGKVFLRLERDFDKHVTYCRDEPNAQQILDSDDDVRDYFEELSQRLGDDKTLSEHLKLPIQRINDYQLLLKELVRYSTCLGEDSSDLQRALELMLSIPHRAQDDKFTSNIEGYHGSIHKLGRLLTHDWFSVTSNSPAGTLTKERYLFLFKARVLICKVRRISEDRSVFQLKDIIRIPEVVVCDHPDKDKTFELHHPSNPIYPIVLTAHRENIKQVWLEEIQEYASDIVSLGGETTTTDDLASLSVSTFDRSIVVESSQHSTKSEEYHSIESITAVTEVEQKKVPEKSKAVEPSAEEKPAKQPKLAESTVELAKPAEKNKEQLIEQLKSIKKQEEKKSVEQTKPVEQGKPVEQPKAVGKQVGQPKAAEKPVEQPKVVEKPIEQPKSVDEIKVVQQPKLSEQPITVEKPVEQPSPVKKLVEQPKADIQQKPTEKPIEQPKPKEPSNSAEQPKSVERPKPIEQEKPAAKPVEQPKSTELEKPVVKPVEKPKLIEPEKPVVKSAEPSKPVEQPKSTELEKPAAKPVEQPKSTELEKPVAKPVEKPKPIEPEKPVVKRAEPPKPVEQPKSTELEKPKPIEPEKPVVKRAEPPKPVEQPKSTEPEKPVAKPVEQPKPVEQSEPIELGKPVAKPVEPTKSIAQPKPVEQTKTSEQQKPVERLASVEESKEDSKPLERRRSVKTKGPSTYPQRLKEKEEALSLITESSTKQDSAAKMSDRISSIQSSSTRMSKTEVHESSSYSSSYGSKTVSSAYGESYVESSSYGGAAGSISESRFESSSARGAIEGKGVTISEVHDDVLSSQQISHTLNTSAGSEKSRLAVSGGKPFFSRPLQGHSVEPGETASFEVTLGTSPDTLTWLKDNKRMDELLADRATVTTLDDNRTFKFEIQKCRVSDSGTYTALATNKHGNSTCTAQLLVHELTPDERRERDAPTFIVKLKDTELLEETYLRFMVKVKGNPIPEVTFYKNGTEIKQGSETIQINSEAKDRGFYELIIPCVKPSDAGNYSCVAYNKHGDVTSEAKVTVVNDKKLFEDIPEKDVLLPRGEKPKFMWRRDGVPFEPEERFKVLLGDDEDSLALVFQHVKPEDAGLYTCVAQTSSGHISCSAELTVQGAIHQIYREPMKPQLIVEAINAVANVGATCMMELQVKGYPKPIVTWTHDGKPVEPGGRYKFLYDDEENMSLMIKNVSQEDAGTYVISATNELGKDSAHMQLIVKAPPKIKTKVEDAVIMIDEIGKIAVEIEGIPKPDVQFYKDGQPLTLGDHYKVIEEGGNTVLVINKAQFKDTGSYSVVATNEMAQVSQFFKVEVHAKPKILKDLGKHIEVRQSQDVTLSIQMQAEPAPEIHWYKGTEEISSSDKHYIISKDGDTYLMKISGAVDTDSCTYAVKAKNIHGTTDCDVRVDVHCAPKILKPLADVTATEEDKNVELNLKMRAYPKPQVKWFLDEMEISEKSNEYSRIEEEDGLKLVIKEVTSELSGKYTCKLVNEHGEVETSAKLTVNCKPRIIKKLQDTVVDEGATLHLSIEVDACPSPSVKWLKNGSEVSADARIKITRDSHRHESFNLEVDLVKFEDRGEYEVVVQNCYGTVSSKSTVTVQKVLLTDAIEESEEEEEPQPVKVEIVEQEPEESQPIITEETDASKDSRKASVIEELVEIIEVEVPEEPPQIPEEIEVEVEPKQAKSAEIAEVEEKPIEEPQKVIEQDAPPKKIKKAKQAQKEEAEIISPEQEILPEQKELDRRESLKPKIEGEIFDDEMEALLHRVKQQRSILGEILNKENGKSSEEAAPNILESNMKEELSYASLKKTVVIKCTGNPQPTASWTKDGCSLKPEAGRLTISQDGEVYKLEIDPLKEADTGTYEVKLSNVLGEEKQSAKLEVRPEAEYRKPIVTKPLSEKTCPKGQTASRSAVITGDPVPDVTWFRNGEELHQGPTLALDKEVKELENNLKEVTYSLAIPCCGHYDTGVYTIKAKNKWGEAESSAQLTVVLKPEIEGPKDVLVVPGEATEMSCIIHACPNPVVTWSRNGQVMKNSDVYEIVEDVENETYRLIFKKVSLGDECEYIVSAKNSEGETTAKARIKTTTEKPKFITGLTDNSVPDYGELSMRTRSDGIPRPEARWLLNGNKIVEDDRHKIVTHHDGQVVSELTITHFNIDDVGKYSCISANCVGEAETLANVSMAQTSPTFTKRLEPCLDVDEDDVLELKAKIHGSPLPTVAWFKDGKPIDRNDPRIITTVTPDGNVKLRIEQATPADSGAYKLVITNKNGENVSQSAVAVQRKPMKPKFLKGIEDAKVVVGEPLRLEAEITAYPPPEVKWFKDGLPIRPQSGICFETHPDGRVALQIDFVEPDHPGVYTLVVSNRMGEATSAAQVDLEERPRAPEFIVQLKPTTVVEGFPAIFEVRATGCPTPEIRWTRNGSEVVPDKKHVSINHLPDGSSALLLERVSLADAMTYQAIATNSSGEAITKGILTVEGKSKDAPEEKPQFMHNMRDCVTDEGLPLVLEVPFSGNPIPEVSWTKNGEPIESDKRTLLTCDGKKVGLTIHESDPSDGGQYACTLTNPLGSDTTEAKATVRKIYCPPKFTLTFSDLQQLPTYDAKFPAKISGVPQPVITWHKDGEQIHDGLKYRIKHDGDNTCLYIRNCEPADAGLYKCSAHNKEGEAHCEATLSIVDKIQAVPRKEPPSFLKRIGDTELYPGMTAKFTACASGHPEPEVEWFREGIKLFPADRIHMERDRAGLLRLTISGVTEADLGKYTCRIHNEYGSDTCDAKLTFDSLDLGQRKPIADQYSEFDKYKRSGAPLPLSDPPIIAQMTDRHCTLSWRPSIHPSPRYPVTYQLEMCELPNGNWFTVRTGIRTCTCGVRNLEPFRDYKFRVRVENAYGISDPSPYAITHREKLEPDMPKFRPYLEPGIDFRPETSPYFPKDFDIDRPPHGDMRQAPVFLRREQDVTYGVKGQGTNLFWFVYGYPKPTMTYYFNDELIEPGGRFDMSYTRNGQATLFINKMLDRDVGMFEAVARNEHGEARQRVRLEIAEHPMFLRRPNIEHVMLRGKARFDARIVGVPYPEIKWYKDWQPLAASSRIKIQFIEPDISVLIINDAILKDEGLYSVSARNVAGSASSSAMLYVEENDLEYSYRTYSNLQPVKLRQNPLEDLYDLGDELGRGTQGITYHAVDRKTGSNYAAKVQHGRSDVKPFMHNEFDVMNFLKHKKLIRLHDAYERDSSFILVTELAAGGELVRDSLLKQDYIVESEIAGYIRQILWGLEYMHEHGYAHMGLTIGDLLLSHPGGDDLKIGDFGLARRIILGRLAPQKYGVPEYCSPETVNGEGVGLSTDMWSLGIITYILLSGMSPFRGKDDRETLNSIKEGKWSFDDKYWKEISDEAKDFISKLLIYQIDGRMDVKAALRHPWLNRADRIPASEYKISTERLRNYYLLFKEWYDNASCRKWFRRRPLEGAYTHPSRMVYPPGEYYTPEPSPDRSPRKPATWEDKIPSRAPGSYEIGIIKSESHYQNGPDTYLLQLRDVDFPCRLREYMKVATNRGPGRSLIVSDDNGYDWRTPIIRERRRFTDVMDEEIDDERRSRINNYGDSYNSYRRLKHELGTRLDEYVEAEAVIESKQTGSLPFFREKPHITAIIERQEAVLTCFAVGDPKPVVQWFKNDAIIAESARTKFETDEEGRSIMRLCPALSFDVGMYKVVARNRVGQTVAHTRVVAGTSPDPPDSPEVTQVSDTEALLNWRQPKYDGHSPVLCYSLQYKLVDDIEWTDCANNIDHEFYLIRTLEPEKAYVFRLASKNAIGWSEHGVPTAIVRTKESGAPKIQISKTMQHLQHITDSGQEVVPEVAVKPNYALESQPLEWITDTEVTQHYNFISEICKGRFSAVVKGVDKRNDSVVVAKILELNGETNDRVEQEFTILRTMRHERIAGLLAAYRQPGGSAAAFILEKLQGADVLTFLASKHEYSEQVVATIVSQILDALQYIHWRGHCHLDLQPSNVVMCGLRTVQVKLVDFGSAQRVNKLGTPVQRCGHRDYISPEMLNDEPAFPQTDIWSLGVLTYVMLSGTLPFKGADDNETRQNINFVRYRFENLYKEVSQEATRFLMLVFKRTPSKRPSAEEGHEHRWFQNTDFMIKKRERAIFLGNRLKEYSDAYHAEQAGTESETIGKVSGRINRSHSIQDELLATP